MILMILMIFPSSLLELEEIACSLRKADWYNLRQGTDWPLKAGWVVLMIKREKKWSILLAVALCASFLSFKRPASAYFEPASGVPGNQTMNGIGLDQYPHFEKSWQLVTVRYREDSGELRFIYANEIAYKAMQSFTPVYPDGSVFGKIGLITEDDPSFPSSKIPAGSKRYQFMVKDKKKYASTDGWGYALFNSEGQLYDEDPKAKTQACVACHRLVPERDFIFARQMVLGVHQFSKAKGSGAKTLDSSVLASSNSKKSEEQQPIEFEQVSRRSLSAEIQKQMEKYDVAYLVKGEIQRSAFSGTLDEIVPALIKKAMNHQGPALLVANNNNFSAVVPVTNGVPCQNKIQTRLLIHVTYNSKTVRHAEICQ